MLQQSLHVALGTGPRQCRDVAGSQTPRKPSWSRNKASHGERQKVGVSWLSGSLGEGWCPGSNRQWQGKHGKGKSKAGLWVLWPQKGVWLLFKSEVDRKSTVANAGRIDGNEGQREARGLTLPEQVGDDGTGTTALILGGCIQQQAQWGTESPPGSSLDADAGPAAAPPPTLCGDK